MSKKINEKIKQRVVELYSITKSLKDIGSKLSLSPTTVKKILIKNNIKIENYLEYTSIKNDNKKIDLIKKLYASGLSPCEICKRMNRIHINRKPISIVSIIDLICEFETINDEFIIKIFFYPHKNEIIPMVLKYFNSNFNSGVTTNNILEFLKNRYTDSESLKETLLRIFYKKHEKPLCAECHKNKVNFTANKFVFTKFCSKKCSRNNEESQKKI